jgi:hypothetical protein
MRITQGDGLDLSREGVRRYMTLLRASALTDSENEERRAFLRYMVQPMAWVYYTTAGKKRFGKANPQEVFVKRARSYSTNIPLDVWLNSMCREFGAGQPPEDVVEVVSTLTHSSGEILRWVRKAAVIACGMAITIAHEWREEKKSNGTSADRADHRDVDNADARLPFRD